LALVEYQVPLGEQLTTLIFLLLVVLVELQTL
jgi:hypothetical protein